MNLIADESVDYRIITYLHQNSCDVFAIIDNDASIPDTEVLKKSVNANALLITEDKDFGELVFRLKLQHSGILLLRFFNTTIENQQEKVLLILQSQYKNLKNNFSTISDNRLRIRQNNL